MLRNQSHVVIFGVKKSRRDILAVRESRYAVNSDQRNGSSKSSRVSDPTGPKVVNTKLLSPKV